MGKGRWEKGDGKREMGDDCLTRMSRLVGLWAVVVVASCASRTEVRSSGRADHDAEAGGTASRDAYASSGGSTGTSGSGSGKVDGRVEAGSMDAGYRFPCGTETCGPGELCVFQCCPPNPPPPPPCIPRPEGGPCPTGAIDGCFVHTCPFSACCQPIPDICTPPPPTCVKGPVQGCVSDGRRCEYLCH
jgi:hypothetical protein